MKKETTEYRIGKFVDYAGQTRNYIVAAVSQTLPTKILDPMGDLSEEVEHMVVAVGDYVDQTVDQVVKKLSLGFAVCAPDEKEFNEALGKKIAYGKATNPRSCVGSLYVTKPGFINSIMVDAFLAQEMDNFERNPGSVLKGYNKAAQRWREQERPKLNGTTTTFPPSVA